MLKHGQQAIEHFKKENRTLILS